MNKVLASLIFFSLVSSLPMDARAEQPDGAAWRTDPIVVRDYTHELWRPHVSAIVDEFNAEMPQNVPAFRYEAMPVTGDCYALMDDPQPDVLAVCDGGWERNSESGATWRDTESHVTTSAVVMVKPWGDGLAYPSQLLCHEFMHAVTGIVDARPPEQEYTSCVQGNLEHLGPFDVAYAQTVYDAYGLSSEPAVAPKKPSIRPATKNPHNNRPHGRRHRNTHRRH